MGVGDGYTYAFPNHNFIKCLMFSFCPIPSLISGPLSSSIPSPEPHPNLICRHIYTSSILLSPLIAQPPHPAPFEFHFWLHTFLAPFSLILCFSPKVIYEKKNIIKKLGFGCGARKGKFVLCYYRYFNYVSFDAKNSPWKGRILQKLNFFQKNALTLKCFPFHLR